MSIAAASPFQALDLQCSFAGTRLPSPWKVTKFAGYGASYCRFGRGRVLVSQGSERRTRCLAYKHGLETFRADFSTSNEADIAAGNKKESFVDRLTRAWSVLFPVKTKPSSNREIAKQRLKMILVSDRCSVNDEAKKKIVTNIVGALSDFVEIQSEEKVQFIVTSDAELNTVCSVTVPVRRVRPQYQEFSRELVNSELQSLDYEEEEGSFRMVDIRFERPGAESFEDW